MQHLKRLLILTGILMVALGLMTPNSQPVDVEVKWEKITDEEIHTYQQEKREAENIPEHETDRCIKEGTSDTGSDSTSERDGDEEEPPAAGLMTKAEEEELLNLTSAEAESEGEDGQWLVMSVVMNRVASPEFPDNVHDVIYQYKVAKGGRKIYQFSCVSDDRMAKAEPNEDTEKALERIKQGDIAPELIAFEVTSSNVLDEWFEYAFTFKNHKFYTLKH